MLRHRFTRAFATVLASVVMLAGCAFMAVGRDAGQPTAEPQPDGRSQEQKDALLDYVDAERAMIPKIFDAYPGFYSEVTVNAKFDEVRNSSHLPDGIYAVVLYDYTYVPGFDLAEAYRQIEGSESAVTELCETSIFPAMRAFGVDPPYGANFTYHAAEDTIGPVNTLGCSATR